MALKLENIEVLVDYNRRVCFTHGDGRYHFFVQNDGGVEPTLYKNSVAKHGMPGHFECRRLKIDSKFAREAVDLALAYALEHKLFEAAFSAKAERKAAEDRRSAELAAIGRQKAAGVALYRAAAPIAVLAQRSTAPDDALVSVTMGELRILLAAMNFADAGAIVDPRSYSAENFAMACDSGTVRVRGFGGTSTIADEAGTIEVPAVRYKGDKFKGQDTFTTIVAELPDGRKVRHYLDTGTEEFFTLPKRESVPEIGPAGFPAEALEA